jgi:NADP-dependent 3-hydroxy acid dehydrogenase YdfG
VAAGARRRDRLEALAERVDGAVHVHEVDITDEAASRSFIEDSADALGGLDVLVNNAGVTLLGPVTAAPPEWRSTRSW